MPINNKLKYQLELIHVYKSANNQYWHNSYMHEWPLPFTVHLSQKLQTYKGIPLLDGQFEYSPLEEYKTPPRGGTDGKITK